MTDCVFCKIAKQEIQTTSIASNDKCVAFADLNPQAPTHILVIPKKHIASLAELPDGDEGMVTELVAMARKVAKERGISKNGYRVVINTNDDAGQSVHHMHLHLLGGRKMNWPPG